ncbi:MAG: hypothetical protein AB7Y46_13415 [Armatimonadota bacterium]
MDRTGPRRLLAAWTCLAPLVLAVPAAAQHIVVFEAYAPADSEWAGDVDIGARVVTDRGETAGEGEVFTPVCSGSYAEQRPVAVSDGAGGAIVVCEAVARQGEYVGDYEIIAQRIGPDGKLLWQEGERSVVLAASNWSERNPVVVPDGAGGAFVIFEAYAPAGSQWAGDVDIRGQHVSADGQVLWGEAGVQIASGTYLEQAPCAVADGAGGVIVVFQAAAREGEFAGDWEIAAQRVGPDGSLLWGEGESSVAVASSRWRETRPCAVSDGAGGALVFFQAEATEGEFAGDIDILGQRLSAQGELMWEGGQRSAMVLASEAHELAPAAVADGAGGAIVICQGASREGQYAGDWEILAQRVSPDGEALWNDGNRPAVLASTTLHEMAPCALPDGAGGALVVFEGHGAPGSQWAGDIDVLAQRVSVDGETLWSAEPGVVLVSASSEYLEGAPALVSDGAGGAIVTFEVVARQGQYAGDYEVAAQRISPQGALMWNDGAAVIISSTTWSERAPMMPGGAFTTRGLEQSQPQAGQAPPATGGPPAGVNRVNPAKP